MSEGSSSYQVIGKMSRQSVRYELEQMMKDLDENGLRLLLALALHIDERSREKAPGTLRFNTDRNGITEMPIRELYPGK